MINNLELKLSGQEPVTRRELFELIDSWGRKDCFITMDNIDIDECDVEECYDLSNLDVSQIDDFSYIFRESMYNGDISKWNISNVTNMSRMFGFSNFNNDSLKDWNLSNVENIEYMFAYSIFNNDSLNSWNVSNIINISFLFYQSKFNGDISNWDVSNIKYMISTFDNCPFNGDISSWKLNKNVDCYEIFCDNTKFKKKYNDGKKIPNDKNDFLEWFEENKYKIKEINTPNDKVLDFFSFPCFSEQVM